MKTATKNQQEILDYIKKYINDNGISPSNNDIAEFFSRSKTWIIYQTNALKKKGLLKKRKYHPRSFEIV